MTDQACRPRSVRDLRRIGGAVLVLGLAACGAPTTAAGQLAVVSAAPSESVAPSPVALPSATLPPLDRPSVASSPVAPVVNSPSAACPPSGFSLELGGVDAAMGLRVVALLLTNCGARRRNVNGYPRVDLFDQSQQPLPIKVTRGAVPMADPDPGPAPLVLRPGQTALAVLSWRNTVLADGTDPITGEYVAFAVRPGKPVDLQALHVDAGTTRQVAVTAWQLPAK